ncbi:hypothetical protein C8J55DRAFT_563827 [Lentinula edodes]|uniref:Uncharacterized protein n=1 Tax=Lentinula lateritia TaxID=40482 RepID=A0A9W8ZZR6_9AGAR|nr:hypothetical protein C8J55DRAFT_563827 [Lentinula edodes]
MRSSLAYLLIGLLAVVRAAPFDLTTSDVSFETRGDLSTEVQEELHPGSHNGPAYSQIHIMFDWSKQHGPETKSVPQGVADRLKDYFRTIKPPLPATEYTLTFDHGGKVWSYDNDSKAFDFYWWAEGHTFKWTRAHLPEQKRIGSKSKDQVEGGGESLMSFRNS